MRCTTARGTLTALALLCLAAASIKAQDAPPVPDTLRKQLLAIEQSWDDALVAKDLSTLQRIMAPGFRFIDADGSIMERQALLDGIASPKLVIDPFLTRDVQVRVYGATAVLTGWFEQTGTYAGERFHVRQRYTDVYARQDTSWVAVSAHASNLAAT
jgi:ketosteroid isomerase-like protein